MALSEMIRTNGWRTIADVLDDLGVGPERIRLKPAPGKATEADLIRIQDREKRRCELVHGILVEKMMGAPQSCLASDLDFALRLYLRENDIGFVMLPDGPTRLWKGLVRFPDLSLTRWERMPSRERPTTPICAAVPNLAVEIISESNTKREIERKLKEYFLAGVELVWVVDPYKRTVVVYTSPDEYVTLTEKDTLDGGTVMPGFSLKVRELFAGLPKGFRKSPRRKKTN